MPPPPPPPPTTLPTSRAFLTNLLHKPPTLQPPARTTSPISQPPTTNTTALPRAKPLLLTLHALFPALLLPALDLLDRHLITKHIHTASSPTGPHHGTTPEDVADRGASLRTPATGPGREQGGKSSVIYYVESSARTQRHGRPRHGSRGEVSGGTSYEVRTRGWSCSCAAFAFAAFNSAAAAGGGREGGGYADYDGAVNGGDDDEEEEEEEDVMLLDADEADDADGGVGGSGEWRWGGLMVEEEDVPLCKHLLACVLAERWDGAGALVEEREVGREEMAGWAAGWGG